MLRILKGLHVLVETRKGRAPSRTCRDPLGTEMS